VSASGRGGGLRAVALSLLLCVTVAVGGVATGATLRGVPPPTPVPPNGSPSPFPTALQTPATATRVPSVSSPSAVLEDLDTGQVLYGVGQRTRRPVASLTKVMTALVVLSMTDPSEMVTVSARAAGQTGSELGLEVGERISVRNLLFALLLQSANDAAVALAEHVAGSVEAFVPMMNARAQDLGLADTAFGDPAGLDDGGYSSARDLAVIARAAHEDPLFARVVATKFHDIPAPDGTTRHIQNRNILLWLYPGAIGTKTGFTTAAGHCLVAAADQVGMRLLVVALGASGPDAEDVFDDAAALLNYGFASLARVTFVRAGQVVGTIDVDGLPVSAAAVETFVLLIPRDLVSTTEYVLVPAAGLTLPIGKGTALGRVVVRVEGKRVGVVGLGAAETVAAPAPTPSATTGVAPPSIQAAPARILVRSGRVFAAILRALIGPFL
jgi:serine-type D-Ala-D-Ala carboxypeptidase (penicillin-binding protein 5/6)